MLDRRVLARAYFTHDRLVRHQIDSFNRFLDEGLQRVIDEHKIIELDIPDTYIKLGKVWVGKPMVKEADGTRRKLFPAEARLRNLTYAAPIYLEAQIVDEGRELEEEVVEIGMLPIMLKSKACNLNEVDDVTKVGEDPLDPGGYFIINGSERALVTLEDLAPNKILLEKEEKYGEEIEVA
ncbi:MAG TPA: DNA-directed RNA polymerase subunit B'', partial [Archaeoglobus profundus]|nr:DNA-directed RNA polymerase subunit B'' [Archaeoglobus profundus]